MNQLVDPVINSNHILLVCSSIVSVSVFVLLIDPSLVPTSPNFCISTYTYPSSTPSIKFELIIFISHLSMSKSLLLPPPQVIPIIIYLWPTFMLLMKFSTSSVNFQYSIPFSSHNPKGLEGSIGYFRLQEPSITNDNISTTNSNNNPSTSPIADLVNETSTAPEVYPNYIPLVCLDYYPSTTSNQ